MNLAPQLNTWVSLLDDQPIEAADEEALLSHLAGDACLRDEVLADHQLHGALRLVARSRAAGADFVERTLASVAQLAGERQAAKPRSVHGNEVWSFATPSARSAAIAGRLRPRRDWTTIVLAMAAAVSFVMLTLVWYATRPKP